MPARRRSASDLAHRYAMGSLGRALDVLELIGEHPDLSAAELAARSGLTKVTVFRILANLERRLYVLRDDRSGRYRLGMKILHLAGRLNESLDLRSTARPILELLRREGDETVNLAVPVDSRIAYIDILVSSHGLRMAASVGKTDDCHSTALGKAMLAHEPIPAVVDLVRALGLPRKTDRTIVDQARLLEELRVVRDRGYAIDDEENEPGARCVAAPVFGPTGAVVAAVSISGPATRMTRERLAELGAAVRQASVDISELLGYRPQADGPAVAGIRRGTR